MGFFSLPMARMLGPSGRVICVDLQPKMIDGLMRRARKPGLADRIEPHVCRTDSLMLDVREAVDFALVFAVVHEVPDPSRLMREIRTALKPGGLLLIAEPKSRVTAAAFAETTRLALAASFTRAGEPSIVRCRTILLRKS
jgi:SAM-dependent methyltransferase